MKDDMYSSGTIKKIPNTVVLFYLSITKTPFSKAL